MISFFRKNLPEKCLAVIVAIGCWIFVMNDQNPQIENTYTVPIGIVNAPEGYQISKDVEEVKLKVRAPRSLFSNVETSSFRAYVDLNGVENGIHDLQIQTVLPSGFELISAGPTKVSINVDKIEQKEVPVRLNLSGIPGDDKVVASVEQSLQNITIEGPVSILNKVTAAVGYIGVNGNNENFSVTVPLIAVNDKDKEVEGKKIIDIKPTLMSDLPMGYILKSVKVEPEKIEVSGNPDIIGNMTYLSTENISLANVTKSTKQTVNLIVPEDINVPNQEVTVWIEIETKENKTDNKTNK